MGGPGLPERPVGEQGSVFSNRRGESKMDVEEMKITVLFKAGFFKY